MSGRWEGGSKVGDRRGEVNRRGKVRWKGDGVGSKRGKGGSRGMREDDEDEDEDDGCLFLPNDYQMLPPEPRTPQWH